jgi:hypothetical protein
MGSTISRSFFLPIYWLRKIYDLQLELRSSNPSQGSIKQSFVFLKMVYCEGKRTMMASTISRSFFLPVYWLRKIYDLQLELRSSNPRHEEKNFLHKFYNIHFIKREKRYQVTFFPNPILIQIIPK